MNVRGSSLFIALGISLSALVAGCEPPKAQFSYSKGMDDLLPVARNGASVTGPDGSTREVMGATDHLVASFGTPTSPVVWPKLSLHFGSWEGEVVPGWEAVVATSEKQDEDEFLVELIEDDTTPDDPTGATIEWLSGRYAGARIESQDGSDPQPAVFQVAEVAGEGALRVRLLNFDASTQRLILAEGTQSNTDAQGHGEETADELTPPLPGAQLRLLPATKGDGGRRLTLVLKPVDENEDEFPEDPAGLAIRWEDGPYAETVVIPKNGQPRMAAFRVADYDRQTHLLRVEIVDFDPSREELVLDVSEQAAGNYAGLPTPAPGTRFAVVGNRLKHGKELFTVHCMHCHGVSGDGNGPTAKYLNPLPRDYRPGLFKFTSTKSGEKARRDDLRRTISHGIRGTYMPSFMLLEDEELDAVIEYVLYLTYRGEIEQQMIVTLDGEGFMKNVEDPDIDRLLEYLQTRFSEDIDGAVEFVDGNWQRAERKAALVMPEKPRTPDSPESRERGRAIFLSAKAQCVNCHGVEGLGNGPQTEEYEKDPQGNYLAEPGLHDAWGHIVQPRNLTRGVYRGGRRPIDIYRRIYAGISPSKMPAFGGTVLGDEEIWDLVNYVLSIPYENGMQPTLPAPTPPHPDSFATASEASETVEAVE